MKKSLWAILFITSLSINAWGASFTINVSDIEVEDIKPGVPASLLQKIALPLTITNTDNINENISFEVAAPTKEELREGYEPIPDGSWLKFEKDNFVLTPNQSADLDMVIYAPYDQKLFAKKYEAILVTYTMQGVLKINLRNKIFFSFSADFYPPSVVNESITEDGTNNSTLLMAPKLLSLDKINPKKNLDVANIMIINSTPQTVKLSFYAIGLNNVQVIPGLVTPKTPTMELKSRETKILSLAINFPLLRIKNGEPMRLLIGAKDTKKAKPVGQLMILDLNFL